AVVRNERERMRRQLPPRRVVAINVVHRSLDQLVYQYLAFTLGPISTRMRHGFVLPQSIDKEDWLKALSPGPAGVRVGPEIVTRKPGMLASGPGRHLESGRYRLTVRLNAPEEQRQFWRKAPCVIIEILSAGSVFGVWALSGTDIDDENRDFTFDVPIHMADAINSVETRLRVLVEVEV